ncbi:MAG: YfiR/HmsC family protein [Tenacibaculum sp.]|nr:YfiR/HmsC family protein [Tenacibaculum sp.]
MIQIRTKFLFFILLAFLNTINSFAQTEEVKRRQRALFIFNFAEQIGWSKTIKNDFTIGVLGKDQVYTNLKDLAKWRKIQNKPVKIKQFSSIKDIKNVQLVFVNQKFNYDINYLIHKITNKNILLVTEDYGYKTSMINIVSVNNSFSYEINEQLLSKENFKIAPSLKRFAISSSEKWKQLYKTTEKELTKAEETTSEQKEVIENKEQKIQSQQQTIKVQEKELTVKDESIQEQTEEIEKLFDENEFQKKKYEEKLLIEKELEKRIQKQLGSIQKQEKNILLINSEIKKQHKKLVEQSEEIDLKETILKEKDHKLNTQKTINYLLIILVGFVLLISFLIFRSYTTLKKFNKELAIKNNQINKQAIQLAAKNKELEQFAHITSHDLKEPLASIFSFANELEENHKEELSEDAGTFVRFITRASNRGLQFIDALLGYFKLGNSESTSELINCNKLISDIETDLSSLITRNNATINKGELPTITGSTIELRLLFQNLINNAIKFKKTDTDPIINITSQKISPDNNHTFYWKFSISDNGIGIADEHKDRIFVIFKRLHSKEQYDGTGIGLAYCKKIVESIGGKIWFESQKGIGTTFHFTIPIQENVT